MSATPGAGVGAGATAHRRALDMPAAYETSEGGWRNALFEGRVCVGYARSAKAAGEVGALSPGRLTMPGKHLRDCPGIECVHVMSETDLERLGEEGTLEAVWKWWRDQQEGLDYTEEFMGTELTGGATGRAAAASEARPHLVRLFTVNHGRSGQEGLATYRTPSAQVSAEKWCSPFTRARLGIMERVWVVFHERPVNPLQSRQTPRQSGGQAGTARARKPQAAKAGAVPGQAKASAHKVGQQGGRGGSRSPGKDAGKAKPAPANLGRFQDTFVGLCASLDMVHNIARAQVAGRPFGSSWEFGAAAPVGATDNRDQIARDWQQRMQIKVSKDRRATKQLTAKTPTWFRNGAGDAMYVVADGEVKVMAAKTRASFCRAQEGGAPCSSSCGGHGMASHASQ